MATPYFTLQQPSMTVRARQPFSQLFASLDASNNPIDIHTGFTVAQARIFAGGNQNDQASTVDVSAVGTFQFSPTGVTWAMTAAQADTLRGELQTLINTLALTLSNDSGATQSIIAKASLTVDNVGGAL